MRKGVEQPKVQELHRGLSLSMMADFKKILDTLESTEATTKISALFKYLRPGPESDLTKRENLIQFVGKCITRQIVEKVKSENGVEETEEAYTERMSQESYNTAKISEKIRLDFGKNDTVHFYVKFEEDKDEYEISNEDTLRFIEEIYQNEKNLGHLEEENEKTELKTKTETERVLELTQLLKQEKKLQKKFEEEAQKQPQEINENDGLSDSERKAIISAVQVQYDGENLSIPTIVQICDATFKFIVRSYTRMTRDHRQERRGLKNDWKKYIELWETHANQLADLMKNGQKEVLENLVISNEAWERSNNFYMQIRPQEIMMIRAGLSERLKMNLVVDDKPLDETKFKEVLRTQTELLNNEAENLDEIMQYVTRKEEVVPIIQNRVNDKIFETYGVEEEHIYKSLEAHMMDPEVQEIFMQLQEVTMRLVPMEGGLGEF